MSSTGFFSHCCLKCIRIHAYSLPFYSNVYKRCILMYFFVKSLQTVPFYIGIILLYEPCFGLRARHALGGPHRSVINFWSSRYMTIFLILILVILASLQITFSERIQRNCWTRGRGEGCENLISETLYFRKRESIPSHSKSLDWTFWW